MARNTKVVQVSTMGEKDFRHKILTQFPLMRDAMDKQYLETHPKAIRIMYEVLTLLEVQPAFSESELMAALSISESDAHILKGVAYILEESSDYDYTLKQVKETWYLVNIKAGVM